MQAILKFIILYYFLPANAAPNYTKHLHVSAGNESDYEALLAIKAQITSGSVLSYWNNSHPFCEWEGVTCGRRHRRVVALELESSRIDGTLSPFVGNLSFLRLLNLGNNSFRGYIPHEISHLRRLRILVLQKNSFEGEIPTNLSSCLQLSVLGLGGNKLVGEIPTQVATLPNLVKFFLGNNNLSGNLQAIGIGNMSNFLELLSLPENQLQGSIPNDIGKLRGLVLIDLGFNLLSGTIPTSFFNLSNMESLSLSGNNIHGHLPQDLGLRLPQLHEVDLVDLSLTGQVPTSLSNLSKLEILDISVNNFIGGFYFNGNNWPRLSWLNINRAFPLEEVRDLSFVDTLTNCTHLNSLMVGDNSFTGIFPRSILNLSTSLQFLILQSNQISGQIPLGLGKFVNLTNLWLGDNHFTGSIPIDIGNLKSMVILDLSSNNISGVIPSSFGNLTLLSSLSLQQNNLEGTLPRSLGNCNNLQEIHVYDNKLSGVLPVELFGISSIIYLAISQNNFQGSFPMEISTLKNLYWLDVSTNRFSGEIPSTLGACTSLTFLNMSGNSFVGSIPQSLSPLKSIQTIDLSYNNFSGPIPTYLSTWPYLSSLNFSFNTLEGQVPVNGVFSNPVAVLVVGNNKLCGGVFELNLPKCPSPRESRRRRFSLKMIVAISVVLIVVTSLAVVALCYYLMCSSSRNKKKASSGLQDVKPLLKVSYQMLSRATNGFSPSNLLGVGGFGSVYKGILHQDDTELVVAVKVMNLQNERSRRSFNAECKVLRNIRHRNLVKVITSCSTLDAQLNDFKALVYEFMPKGSLESWLHSSLVIDEHAGDGQSCALSLIQRLSIAIDAACALEYLHNWCESPIIHCDLKPSNILLDDEMIAHVGDFGLAKLLSGNIGNPSSSTQVRGTVGYAAPEYGLGSSVSLEGDIYSFGIIVLEMMTYKKPTDPMFTEGLNLHNYAQSALSGKLMEMIDQSMLGEAIVVPARNGADIRKIECIKSLIMVGVQCSLELPQERMSIKDVVNELKSAYQSLLYTRT